MKRWCAEVTFEEIRALLGVETQRHRPKTLMSFYFHAQTSLALLLSSVPQLKMCKVQVLSRQNGTYRPQEP